ncbi:MULTISPECIES: glycosyltransferase family 4 protein [unclassified Paenibacillus]|uniref:glycosyltransferase family 4 protein n=1 Tax=unclassified Paenibacillus TaxID=185978 RepID=UPI00070EE36E|nr:MULTISPECIES: glycosyltransferase family 4 protein [unclassified Paenibacillus]KQX49167.1 hypothetical protein ASD40_13660 [Paenibacillus sp. Root444D2]KRE48657.1 hypothetical protein ASG85_26170 [Paenibacillus sp. Soil724D2]
MKILLATSWLLPHLGGVCTFMEQLKVRLERWGHEVDIFGKGANETFHMMNKGIVIRKEQLLPLLCTKMSVGNVFPAVLNQHEWFFNIEMDRYCMELGAAYFGLQQYDFIYAQDVISAVALNRVKPKSTPLLVSLHGSVTKEVYLTWPYRHQVEGPDSMVMNYYSFIEKVGASIADITITHSHWLRNLLVKEFDVPDHHFTEFPYGYDIESFQRRMQESTPLQRPQDKKVIICASRLTYLKGIHDLVTVLYHLKLARKDWVCWIIGEGEDQAELQQQAINHGLQEHVQFFGRRNDVPALLRMSDIYVLPSLIDNQPLSLIEAQLAGKPSVVSDAGGVPEMVVHGHTGLVYPVGDIDMLFKHLCTLLDNENYRHKLGRNAEVWALEHWSPDTMLQRLFHVYNQMLSRKR